MPRVLFFGLLLVQSGCVFGYLLGRTVYDVNTEDTWGWRDTWRWWDTRDTGWSDCGSPDPRFLFPADGQERVYPWTSFRIELDQVDNYTWLALTGGASAPQWATFDLDGTSVRARLQDPLEAGVTYEMVLYGCGGELSTELRVADVGEDAVDAATLPGRLWRLDPGEATILEPWTVDGAVEAVYGERLLLSVLDDGAGGLVPVVAWEGVIPRQQDWCLPTVDWPALSLDDNPFTTGSAEVMSWPLPEQDDVQAALSLEQVWLEGGFKGDGSLWVGELQALADMRSVAELLGTPEDEACALLASLGAECTPCADGEPACMTLHAGGLTALELSGEAPVERVAARDCHARCPDSATNPDCVL